MHAIEEWLPKLLSTTTASIWNDEGRVVGMLHRMCFSSASSASYLHKMADSNNEFLLTFLVLLVFDSQTNDHHDVGEKRKRIDF